MASSKEIWKPIKGYEKHYAVSNTGRVKSLDRLRPYKDTYRTIKGRILKTTLKGDKTMYETVLLSKNNVKKCRKVHHLVLETFTGRRPKNAVARHLDDNPQNNDISNLVWGTISENTLDKFRNGYRHAGLILSDAKIEKILRASGSQRSIAKKFSVSQKTVLRIQKGQGYYGKF